MPNNKEAEQKKLREFSMHQAAICIADLHTRLLVVEAKLAANEASNTERKETVSQ